MKKEVLSRIKELTLYTDNLNNKLSKNFTIRKEEADEMFLEMFLYAYLSNKECEFIKKLINKETDEKKSIFDLNKHEWSNLVKEVLSKELGYSIHINNSFIAQQRSSDYSDVKVSEVLKMIEEIDNNKSDEQFKYRKLFECTESFLRSTFSDDIKTEIMSEILMTVYRVYELIEDIETKYSECNLSSEFYEVFLENLTNKYDGRTDTRSLAILMAKLVTAKNNFDEKDQITIADPTCGSGGFLHYLLNEIGTDAEVFGQDISEKSIKYSAIRFILSNREKNLNNLYLGNILEDDYFYTPKSIRKFALQVCNPPFGLKATKSVDETEERFKDFNTFMNAKSDITFVQHVVGHMTDNGRAAIILPHGVLSRGGLEEKIRKELFQVVGKTNIPIVDAIIGLPVGMVAGTGIPVCIIILDRNKTDDLVTFIDASYLYRKDTVNYLDEEVINAIVELYKTGETEMVEFGYGVANTNYIVELNNCNLTITRYTDEVDDEPLDDVEILLAEIDVLDETIEKSKKEIKSSLSKLGILK